MERYQYSKHKRPKQQNANYNAKEQKQQTKQQEIPLQQYPIPPPTKHSKNNNNKSPNAYVKIVEQPASKSIRFRYECERRSAGSIVGINSSAILKTYPTIEVVGYKGRAIAVVSCVTKDEPYRPHPYSLIGKEGCRKGVCTVEINSGTMRYVFNSLGIQCVKKKEIDEALQLREEIRVDPFKTGFSHRSKLSSSDLNAIRLCFQIFIEDDNGRFTIPLKPIVSKPILNRNSTAELIINDMCNSGTVLGNTQIVLLCEKVCKDDIAVRFFEPKDGISTWEATGTFQPSDVYKQTSIIVKIPRYHNVYITEPKKVYVQLKRPSDGELSEPWEFTYKPLVTNVALLRRKHNNNNNNKGKGAHAIQQTQNCSTTTNNPDIAALELDTKKLIPTTTTTIYPTSNQMTPSPQPNSPPPLKNNQENMNPLYKPTTLVNNNNTPPKSPHDEYDLAAKICDITTNPTNLPTTNNFERTNIENECKVYNNFEVGEQLPPQSSQQHYFQQIERQPLHAAMPCGVQQQQQQHNFANNTMYYNANNWDEGYMNFLRDVNNGNLAALTTATATAAAATMNNFYNNSNNNYHYSNIQNGIPNLTQSTQWNFPLNHTPDMQVKQWQQQWSHNDHTAHHHHHHHHQQPQPFQHLQQQQQQHVCTEQQVKNSVFQQQNHHAIIQKLGESKDWVNLEESNLNATANGTTTTTTTTIGNLLNLGSGELIKVNFEDQQMLQVPTDELQISNLFIST